MFIIGYYFQLIFVYIEHSYN